MAAQKTWWQHVSLRSLQVIGSIGILSMGIEFLAMPGEAQSSLSLSPICVGIAPLAHQKTQLKTFQNRCCQRTTKAKCVQWQQIFPAAVQPKVPSLKRPVAKEDSFLPQLDDLGNSIGSQGAAKDAVIQVGVTKTLDALAPTLRSMDGKPEGDRPPTFFQSLRKNYERILGPRPLKSGAILTPQVGMNLDLGRFNVDSMKVGVEIKF
jgi:hypothetical protein